uniref:DUF6361 family protein n=1 Tax=Burkholderia anthina TaxID=179879 RepID=UPI00158E4339|nr:DUF6361 family protein [Burkholderia anthina]
MSSLGWVDFSADDRARVHSVLALLKQPGTLDELGIGQVRDAFSDVLFPGFSTIQTRARYFLAIPKILLDWASQTPAKRRAKPLANYLRDAENALAGTLAANHKALGLGPDGIIGHTVVEQGGVARRPSSTYWNGLRIFDIVTSNKSLTDFCRDWWQDGDGFESVDGDEGNDDEDHRYESEVRRPPSSRGEWRADLTLNLSKAEADFLSERFCSAKGIQDSITAQLLSTELAEEALAEEHASFAAFSAWASEQRTLSTVCRDHIAKAQRFSVAIEGAHIIFNRLLAERLEHGKLEERCVGDYQSWKAHAAQAAIFSTSAPNEWLSVAVGAKANVKPLTVSFLERWNDAICSGAPQRNLDSLIERQAVGNKPGRSLLVRLPGENSDWYGMKALDYRWQTARRMLRDIVEAQQC